MPRVYSISERMSRARSLEERRAAAERWRESWQDEQSVLIARLEEALKAKDAGRLASALGALKAMTGKRFTGLATVIASLADPDIEVDD